MVGTRVPGQERGSPGYLQITIDALHAKPSYQTTKLDWRSGALVVPSSARFYLAVDGFNLRESCLIKLFQLIDRKFDRRANFMESSRVASSEVTPTVLVCFLDIFFHLCDLGLNFCMLLLDFIPELGAGRRNQCR